MDEKDLIYADESYAIRGAIFEVYRIMGCGFLESVYQECLELELASRGIPYISQPELQLTYKSKPLKNTFKPDLICYNAIVVELKAVKGLGNEHHAQIHNYLKATGLKLGLLVNFGSFPKADVDRIVC